MAISEQLGIANKKSPCLSSRRAWAKERVKPEEDNFFTKKKLSLYSKLGSVSEITLPIRSSSRGQTITPVPAGVFV